MDMKATLIGAGAAAGALIFSAWMHKRRGIGTWSLVPWDYAMILSMILLIVALAHAATLWRDG